MWRVSYNGITSAFQADDAGSIPATRSKEFKAHIAQSVERHLGKVEVTGSTPVMSSRVSKRLCVVDAYLAGRGAVSVIERFFLRRSSDGKRKI
jgi:hypothetical protein